MIARRGAAPGPAADASQAVVEAAGDVPDEAGVGPGGAVAAEPAGGVAEGGGKRPLPIRIPANRLRGLGTAAAGQIAGRRVPARAQPVRAAGDEPVAGSGPAGVGPAGGDPGPGRGSGMPGAAGAEPAAGPPSAPSPPWPPAGPRIPARVRASLSAPARRRIPVSQPVASASNGWSPVPGPAAIDVNDLSARLTALSSMIEIGTARTGRDGFSKKVLGQAEEVLNRAGERMRLSAAHTVVVLAGGTGSGKSSLFNCLAGADFSTVGVTRPVTRDAHACLWDDAGSAALVEWLDVPVRNRYSRSSALGGGETSLAGLVLLDLPDHDSVMGHATGQVDRLVSLADVMIWVVDPQKYADASIHRRFLIPLAGHSDVQAVVLNQADLLTAAQIDDCMADLRRLLDSENLHDVPILATSAVTGSGIDDLRRLLAEGVVARKAAAARIRDDLATVVARFKRYAGEDSVLPEPGISTGKLVEQFYAAAGAAAIGDTLRSARELRAVDFVGWPVAWLTQRLTGRNPLRKVRVGRLWNELRAVSSRTGRRPAGVRRQRADRVRRPAGRAVAEAVVADDQDGGQVQRGRDPGGDRGGDRRGAAGRGQRRGLVADSRAGSGRVAWRGRDRAWLVRGGAGAGGIRGWERVAWPAQQPGHAGLGSAAGGRCAGTGSGDGRGLHVQGSQASADRDHRTGRVDSAPDRGCCTRTRHRAGRAGSG